jgi:hypothetical protein
LFSACAHFEIPVAWIEGATINSSTYSNFLSVLENEFDWPHRTFFCFFLEIVTEMMIQVLGQLDMKIFKQACTI